MSAGKNIKTFGKVLTYVLLLLLVAGVIGFFALFTNGFTDDFKTFYIEHDGQRILKTDSQTSLKYVKQLRFDVKYTFGFMDKKEPKSFSVKIVPNITDNTKFDFTADGRTYSYVGEKDLTGAFDIKQYTDYFTITIPQNYGMQQVLEKVYDGKTIVLSDNGKANSYYYTMLISSYNGKQSYSINFNFYHTVSGLQIDKGEIVI